LGDSVITVVTSFGLALKDIEDLHDLCWSVIIMDEAHRLKNDSSKSSEAFHKFHCPVRFGLTGTSIQNNYMELWTILNWTNPGWVGTKKQWKHFVAKPLVNGQSSGASEEEIVRAKVNMILQHVSWY
jgi:DNA excision repair protein ERCC-6-like 2